MESFSLADGHWASGEGGKTRRLAVWHPPFAAVSASRLVFLSVCLALSAGVFASLLRILPLCFEYQLMCIRRGERERGRERERGCVCIHPYRTKARLRSRILPSVLHTVLYLYERDGPP